MKLTKIGTVLNRYDEVITLDPEQRYQQVTIRINGKGVTQRNEVYGSEIRSKRRYVVREGQFILSRIDARNGAFGIVPSSLDGAVVTRDFPSFIVNQDKLVPAYLKWMSKTASFVELCRRASEGTTNRVRLQENRFAEMEIPLPSVEEQRRIVAKIDALAGKVERARALRGESSAEVTALMQSARKSLLGDVDEGWIPLKYYISKIENGRSPQCEKRPADTDEWGVLKVGAVSFGVFNPDENKALPPILEADPRFEVKTGDFLMNRANTLSLVAACTIVRDTPPKLLLSDKIFRFHFRDNGHKIYKNFLDHVLKSPALRKQIESQASGTSPTMKNISKAKVFNLLVPKLTIEKQQQIAAHLNTLQTKLDTIRQHQAATQQELDALLPAILDKAFKGEL